MQLEYGRFVKQTDGRTIETDKRKNEWTIISIVFIKIIRIRIFRQNSFYRKFRKRKEKIY